LLHRTFQEFLVARHLLRRYIEDGLSAPALQEFLIHKASDPEWAIVLLLLVEQLILQPLPDALPLLHRLSDILLDSVQDRTGQMAVAATEMLIRLDSSDVGAEALRSLRDRLLATMRDEQIRPVMRVHAARLVAELGDPRPEVMEVDGIEFISVAAGNFKMGSDPAVDVECTAEETPQHQAWTRRFAISCYPISNAQYRIFLDDREDGYDNPAYWSEAIALGHWQNGMVWRVRPRYLANGRVEPEPAWSREPILSGWPTDLANNPIMGISWYEARAFVRWLEHRWRHNGLISPSTCLDLPSEAEWEKSARGTDGRIYPWGNEFDGSRLNWVGHMLMAPSPIGSFPHSASPYGAEEMVGNLWEWTRSVFAPYGDSHGAGTDFVDVVAPEVKLAIRGGAYFSIPSRCRCAARSATLPYGRVNVTFRVVKVEEEES
jgi:formylglycine-generating enzyme required for sulfatase activity